ncbi:hypothetical protein [Neorhizobium alkalisoli]|uniref:hypothetical protein n=1 Tax=Neorhizobium alkalisoli TaxID=528178 RepID=UPI001319BA24|nr:hypothetical protein [Neorhizobium alkalisoli]
MFSITHMHFGRFLPHVSLSELISRRLSTHQNNVDVAEMPESWKRDIGMLDGRDRRGPPDEGAFQATRMISMQRSL